jgi:acyl carrier protein
MVFMTELDDRLLRCFLSVFPFFTEETVRAGTNEFVDDMDSLAGVTLAALIDEEFGVQLNADQLLKLRTVDSVQRYIAEQRRPSLFTDE